MFTFNPERFAARCQDVRLRGVKSALRYADRATIDLVVIVGQRERDDGTVVLRDMRSRTETVSRSFWRSSNSMFKLAAIKSAKWPGCSVLSAAILTCSENAGEILAISSNCRCALRSMA